ncbi:MAG: hypothetical protein IKC91_05730 [Clostridia bacterium]|nr:hypothetical protein [Clostridia bacterium]
MKHVKLISISCFVAIISLVSFFTINLKAAWHYAMNATGSIEVPMEVEVFPWVGVEQLPSDILGENHQVLIETIINGTYTDENGNVTDIGLNNPDSYINNEIQNRINGNFWFRSDMLGSMDFWERQDIEKFFNTETTGLAFLIYFPEDQPNVHYLFTTSVDLGENSPNIPIDQKIYPVYRTELKKNSEGIWEAVETKTGYADSAYYQNPITGSLLVKYPSLNPDTWVEGKLGTSMSDAIYAFIGQEVTAYADDTTSCVYYKLTVNSNTTLNISSENELAKLRVLNASGNPIATNKGAQGTNNLSFNGRRGTTYYIEVSGAPSITFSIIDL